MKIYGDVWHGDEEERNGLPPSGVAHGVRPARRALFPLESFRARSMVRKRNAETRAKDRFRIRPKTPAPKTGWVIGELAALTGQRPRTIRY